MKATKRLSIFAFCTMVTLISSLIVNPNGASAGEIIIGDSSLSWNDKMYKSDGCSKYDFNYKSVVKTANTTNIEFAITDPLGRQVSNASSRNRSGSITGTWDQQICVRDFTNGLGPYILKFTVSDFIASNTISDKKEIFFLPLPGATPEAAPAPTQVKTVYVENPADLTLREQIAELQIQITSLKKKISSICSTRPKPKRC